jgi:hypothetical protein
MSNKTYDIIKMISLIGTPAITLVAAVISIWNIPYGAQITATLAAIDTFMGALVVILNANYNKRIEGK